MGRLGLRLSAVFCVLFFAGPVPALAAQSYFLNQEFRSDTINLFPKWTGVLSRYKASARTLDDVCGTETYSPCRLKGWKDFLIGLKDKPLDEQVEEVNGFVNAYPYIEDIVNWGVQDYWETPYEFQQRNGDCEDFSIAKYMSLRALGISDEVLRVTIVRDLHLGGIIHAVLLVTLDDGVYMLDNQIKQVASVKKIYHYMPLYSINEHHWWQYILSS